MKSDDEKDAEKPVLLRTERMTEICYENNSWCDALDRQTKYHTELAVFCELVRLPGSVEDFECPSSLPLLNEVKKLFLRFQEGEFTKDMKHSQHPYICPDIRCSETDDNVQDSLKPFMEKFSKEETKCEYQQEAIAEEDWDKIGAEEHKDNDMQQMSVKEEHHDIMIVQPQHEFEAEAENDMDDAEVEMWSYDYKVSESALLEAAAYLVVSHEELQSAIGLNGIGRPVTGSILYHVQASVEKALAAARSLMTNGYAKTTSTHDLNVLMRVTLFCKLTDGKEIHLRLAEACRVLECFGRPDGRSMCIQARYPDSRFTKDTPWNTIPRFFFKHADITEAIGLARNVVSTVTEIMMRHCSEVLPMQLGNTPQFIDIATGFNGEYTIHYEDKEL